MRGQLRQRKKERFLLAPYAVRGKRFIAAADNPKKKKPTPLDSKIALASSDTDLKNRKPQQPAEKQNIKRTSQIVSRSISGSGSNITQKLIYDTRGQRQAPENLPITGRQIIEG
jgi:hypothetical protein